MNEAEVREKYPQYNDLPYSKLLEGLHAKHYSDMPYDEFAAKMGVSPQQPPQPQAPAPSFYDRLRESLMGTPLDPTPNPYAVAALEKGVSMATGVPGMLVGGLAGTAQAGAGAVANMLGYNPAWAEDGAGARTAQAIQQEMTYQPRTPHAEVIDNVLAQAGAGHQRAQTAMGDLGYNLGGPIGGTVGYMALPVAESVAPFLVGRGAPVQASPLSGELTPPNIMELPAPGASIPEIRAALESGTPNIHTIGYRLEPTVPYLERGAEVANRVVSDPAARVAVRTGIDPDAILRIQAADPLTRRKFGQMVNITDNWLNSGRAQTMRANDISGQAIMNRLQVLTTANRIAGRMVNREVERLTGTVDIAPVINNFADRLQNMGIRITDDGLDFSGSSVELTPAAQTSLQDVFDVITRTARPSARAAHHLKQAVTNKAKLGEQVEGVDAQTTNAIRGIRADVNAAISNGRPGYRNANQHYSNTIETLNDVNKRLGGVEDLTDVDAARTAGIILRRTVSNAVSAGRVNTELGGLTDLSRQYIGGEVQGFPTALLRRATRIRPRDLSDDLNSLVNFSTHLEKRFGSPASTSMHGILDSSAERAADAVSIAGAATSGSPVGMARAGLNLLRRNVRASDAEQLRALRNLIRREE